MTPDTIALVGLRIRALRLERGLTQEELAVRAGLSQSHVSEHETGARVPKLPTLFRIARALDVEPGELLGDG